MTGASPPARNSHALAYDSARGRSVLFGGDGHGLLADTWEYDGANWTQVTSAASPSSRCWHALAYDSARGRSVLFGGGTIGVTGGVIALADTWEYDGTNWTQVMTAASPLARTNHALAYDVARSRMVLFGGESIFASTFVDTSDTWELLPAATATWTRYGLGCAGSAGAPSLDNLPNTRPALGGAFTLRLTSLPAQPDTAFLFLGTDLRRWNGTALPFALAPIGMPQCNLWIAPAPPADLCLAHPGNAVNFTFAIPLVPALAGLVVGTQALVLDAAAPSGVGAMTNAGIMRLY